MLAVMLGTLTMMSESTPLSLVPAPVKTTVRTGSFALKADTSIVASGDALPTARHLQQWLAKPTGYKLPIVGRKQDGTRIQLILDPKLTSLGKEGYRLKVDTQTAVISAAQPAGLFYGAQTLRQLFPASIYSKSKVQATWTAQNVEIEDMPRFGWRGAMMDVARHFRPKADVLKFIDALAMQKINVLHMHLTDDQGWRVEIKKYPKLTQIGSVRRETVIGRNSGKYDGIPHGGFFTQKDLREIVKYAADRHITVVPEIDMPGHMIAAIASYPELGDGGQHEVMREWGVADRVLNMKDSTIQFCKDVLDEVMAIFPSKFIHVGGDECPKVQWDKDPEEQARMKARGLKDSHELQSWFTEQIDAYLDSKGRRLIGWDEILEGGKLAEGAAVMSWRGVNGGIAAAKMGHDVVMSPTSHLYLDYYQTRFKEEEPLAIGGLVTLDKVYSFDPMPADLAPEQQKHILGLQGNLWAEYIKTMEHLEYMAFPRLCAAAEVGWTPQANREFAEFWERLPKHMDRLKAMGVNFRPLDKVVEGRIIKGWDVTDLTTEFQEKSWNLGKLEAGPIKVTFSYTAGAHGMEIAYAAITDGSQNVRVTREGFTGGADKDNVYRFVVPKSNGEWRLLAGVRGRGGTDSVGEIIVQPGE